MTTVTGRREREDEGEIFEALADERRRATLRALGDATGPLSVSELAAELADRQDPTGSETAGRQRVEQLHVSLHHRHLPKLDAAGLVSYDPDRKQVSLAENVTASGVVEVEFGLADGGS